MQSKRGAEELRKIPDSLKRGDGNGINSFKTKKQKM